MRKITLLSLAIILAVLLGGCVSQASRTTAKAATAKAADPKDEYIWYTPTGSNIPIRVRKSDITSRENTTADQEAMRDVTRRGLHMDRRGD